MDGRVGRVGHCELVRAEVNERLTMQGLVKACLYSLLIWSRTALGNGSVLYGTWIWSVYLVGGARARALNFCICGI